jgi:hypothetical protein
MRRGQQVFDPRQPLVELGQDHLAPGRFVLRRRPGPAGTLGDETGRHLRGDHRQRQQPVLMMKHAVIRPQGVTG